MSYGTIKVDTITFTDGGVDKSVSVSGLTQNPTFTGNITVTGTISGDLVQGQTVSGATVTGGAAQFGTVTGGSAGFTTITGTTVTGTIASFTSGIFTNLSGSAVVLSSGAFASGTAALPSVSVGTTSNGLYSPGTNEIAISTSGNGRLFIDSTGNVSVSGDISTIGGTGRLNIRGTASGINNDLQIGNDDSLAYFRATRSNAVYKGFVWYLNNSTSEGMRLTSSGYLGIGLANPTTSRLQVETAADGDYGIYTSSPSSSGVIGFITDGTSGNAIRWGGIGTSGNCLRFLGASNTEYMRITSSGIGVGVTNPSTRFHIADTKAGAEVALRVANTSTTDSAGSVSLQFRQGDNAAAGKITSIRRANYGGVGNQDADLAFFTSVDGVESENMRISSSGVGIGITTPSGLLHVASIGGNNAGINIEAINTGQAQLRIAAGEGATNRAARIDFVNKTTSSTVPRWSIINDYFQTGINDFYIVYEQNNFPFAITSGQRVGIGITNPGAKLQVSNSTASQNCMIVNAATNGIGEGVIITANTRTSSENTVPIFRAISRTNSSALTVTVSGDVLVGSSVNTGNYKLDVVGDMHVAVGSESRGIYFGPHGNTGSIRYNINGNLEIAPRSGYSTAFLASTTGSELARIDPSGRLLIGTTTSSDSSAVIQCYEASGNVRVRAASDSLANNEEALMTVRGGTGAGARSGTISVYKHSGITNPAAYLFLHREDGTSAYYWTDNSGNLRVSSIAANVGTTGGTVVGTQTSDIRLKNVIGPVQYGLNTVKEIEPITYSLKSEPDTEKLGFSAQQIKKIIPQVVFDTKETIAENEPTKLGMEYVGLIPVLVNAIKELSEEVDKLKSAIN